MIIVVELHNGRVSREDPPKHFPKPMLHEQKVMVTVWWSTSGVIHYSFLNPNETITADKYCQELIKMHQKLQKNQPALVNRKGPILLQDNAARPLDHTFQERPFKS